MKIIDARLIRTLLAALAVPTLIALWRSIYDAPCANLFFPLVATLLLTLGFREALVMKRQMWSSWYLERDSGLWTWARRHAVLTVYALLLGMFFSLVLFFSAVAWSYREMALITVSSIFMVVVYVWLLHRLRWAGVREEVLPVLAKSWAVFINIPLMLISLVVIKLSTPPPDYLNTNSLFETVKGASLTVASECGVTNSVGRLLVEKDALGWWMMIRGGEHLSDSFFHGLAWLLFLVSGGIAWWGFSRLCIQVIDMSYRFNSK